MSPTGSLTSISNECSFDSSVSISCRLRIIRHDDIVYRAKHRPQVFPTAEWCRWPSLASLIVSRLPISFQCYFSGANVTTYADSCLIAFGPDSPRVPKWRACSAMSQEWEARCFKVGIARNLDGATPTFRKCASITANARGVICWDNENSRASRLITYSDGFSPTRGARFQTKFQDGDCRPEV
jgi:hypothetical protein